MPDKRKRILHIVEDLGMGGIERVIQMMVLGLDPSRYEVQVWCLARGGVIAEDLLRRGAAVRTLGLSSYHSPLGVLTLAGRLRREGFDIVHAHGYFAGTFARLAALLARPTAVIRHIHTTEHDLKLRNRAMEAFLSRCTDRVLCVSRAVGDFAVDRLFVPPGRIRIVYNAAYSEPDRCTEEDVRALRAKYRLGADDFVVVSVASLTANKGHDVLIRAMQQLVGRHGNVRCLIVGEGRERQELASLIGRLGLVGRVFLTGMQIDVAPFLSLARVLVLCSVRREGLSVSLIEGAAAGLPLLGSDLGGIPEVIRHGVNGFVFPPGDAGALAAAIGRLIDEPALRERMGRQSRNLYQARFSKQLFIAAVEGIYDELTGDGA